jgi:hypothetical protein
MKAKDLIKALANIDPEADVVINVKQSNKRYGFQLPIEYGSMEPPDPPDENNYSYYFLFQGCPKIISLYNTKAKLIT